VYCEEPFVNDGGPLSAIWTNMKRAMAAEFSREYSEKVLVTLCEMARRGYFTGVGRSTVSSARPSPKTEPYEVSFSVVIGKPSGRITLFCSLVRRTRSRSSGRFFIFMQTKAGAV
jgi:hypothetical protein